MSELGIYATIANSALIFMTAVIGAYSLYKGKKRDEQILNLTLHVDGRLSELLAITAKSSHAEGVAEQKANPT